jgi:poly-gamma-glutamate synthesis protein (capsule biosynthesis protein)
MDTPSNSLRLAFTGDVCLGGELRRLLGERGPSYPFAQTAAIVKGADLLVGNLECCLLDDRQVAEAQGRFMAVAQRLAVGLKDAGFDAMTLANNHILDFGEPGLVATRELLERIGVAAFGAGRGLVDAERPVVLERHGRRVALLAATDCTRVHAGRRRAGAAPMHWRRLGRLVREQRELADVVVVCLHADVEFAPYPATRRVRLSRWLVDQGASMVIQHHPHVCQGIEEYRGGLIAYSLGNFVFQVHGLPHLATRPGTTEGLVLDVRVEFGRRGRRLSWEAVPVRIGADHRPAPSSGPEGAAQLRELHQRSQSLHDMRFVRRSWRRQCWAEAKSTARSLYYAVRRREWKRAARTLRILLTSRDEWRWMIGLLSGGHL